MLAIKVKGATHVIISCNLYQDGDKHQLWVERPNGKSMKIAESPNVEQVMEIKDAIDFAIKHREPILELE